MTMFHSYFFIPADKKKYFEKIDSLKATYFIFDLAGESIPFSSKIKIFSVSGRLIKIITTPVNIGHNQIFWDGRDTDGDALANGVYFYKMILQGVSKTETSINKLVILK